MKARHRPAIARMRALIAGMAVGACVALPIAQAGDRDHQVAEIVELVEAHYAFAGKKDAVLTRLAEAAAGGRYSSVDDQTFATRVTSDLRAASGDKHMGLAHDPARYASLASRKRPADRDPTALAFQAGRNRASNYGLAELKILEGNVRYLGTRAFAWTEHDAESAYDAAARFLRDADAIIVDLRRNIGGEPAAVRRLLSYIEKPGTLLYRIHEGRKETEIVSEDIPQAASLAGKPLYVLIGKDSASAAEAFAYHLTATGRGDLLGEPTAGAANIAGHFALAPAFVLALSVGGASHAVTGTDWEGTGVAPTTEMPAERALAAAHLHAVKKLEAAATDERDRLALRFASRIARSRLDPPATAASGWDGYAGTYGDRQVRVRNDQLIWKRGDRPEVLLDPLGDGWFQVGESLQARFVLRDGRATAIELARPDGELAQVERSGP